MCIATLSPEQSRMLKEHAENCSPGNMYDMWELHAQGGRVVIQCIACMATLVRLVLKCDRMPLSINELFKLPLGSSFIVYWAKDDDPVNGLRLDYKRQYISSLDGTTIYTNDGYEWSWEERIDPDDNKLDTGRGIATFWKAT